MERLLKRAEVLSLQGDTGGQKDAIVNELLKVHSRFQARIAEYQLLLNMTIQFFKNLAQVLPPLVVVTAAAASPGALFVSSVLALAIDNVVEHTWIVHVSGEL